ncbi:MAG: helix-turn-helix domain-containing protein [Acutalibacteraceae bacterium]|nr:helix-turn-helix domain-containing protein [Acutalibacteraceae bacterium]
MKKTQKERILDYMNEFGSISSWEAFRDLGITRLAARASDIESDGIPLNRKREATTNRYGEKVYYTRYSIAE